MEAENSSAASVKVRSTDASCLPFGMPDFSSRWSKLLNDDSLRCKAEMNTADMPQVIVSKAEQIDSHNRDLMVDRPLVPSEDGPSTMDTPSVLQTRQEDLDLTAPIIDTAYHFPSSKTLTKRTAGTRTTHGEHNSIPSAAAPRYRTFASLSRSSPGEVFQPVAVPRKGSTRENAADTYISSGDDGAPEPYPGAVDVLLSAARIDPETLLPLERAKKATDQVSTTGSARHPSKAHSTIPRRSISSDSSDVPLQRVIQAATNSIPDSTQTGMNQEPVVNTQHRLSPLISRTRPKKRKKFAHYHARLPRVTSPNVADQALFPTNLTHARARIQPQQDRAQTRLSPSHAAVASSEQQYLDGDKDSASSSRSIVDTTKIVDTGNSSTDAAHVTASSPRSIGLAESISTSQSLESSRPVNPTMTEVDKIRAAFEDNEQRLAEVNRHMRLLLEEQDILISNSRRLMRAIVAATNRD